MTGYPVSPGELVDEVWLNAIGTRLLWDSTVAGVSLPAASITTPTIAATFKHLLVIYRARTTTTASVETILVRVNGISTAAYYDQFLQANNTTVVGGADTAATAMKLGLATAASGAAKETGFGCIWLPDYTDSSDYMIALGEAAAVYGGAAGNFYVGKYAGMYAAGGPITTLTFLPQGAGSFTTGTRFSLYGVA